MKREIEAIRLKTKMSEAFAATRLPYPKQAAIAKMQLNALQESYKQLTGEYAKEFVIESRSGIHEMRDFDKAFEGMLGALKAGGIHAETVSELTTVYDEFVSKAKDILGLVVGESEKANEAKDAEAKKAMWTVKEAVRRDGATVKIGTKYKDGNDSTYTIDEMWIATNGKLMGHAEEGGGIDLGVAKILK